MPGFGGAVHHRHHDSRRRQISIHPEPLGRLSRWPQYGAAADYFDGAHRRDHIRIAELTVLRVDPDPIPIPADAFDDAGAVVTEGKAQWRLSPLNVMP